MINGVALWARCKCDSESATYGLGKLRAIFCFITCKVLVAEWHDQHGWT